MKTLIAVLLLLPLSAEAWAATQSQAFDAANQAYADHHYAEAIAGYESLLDSGETSAPLLFNLGNAYAKTGDSGHAVASYLRAQILAPNDSAIAHNLEQIDGVQSVPWYDRAARLLSMNEWSWLGSLSLTFFALALAVRFLGERSRRVTIIAASTGLALAISFAAIGLWFPFLSQAVVVEQTSARVSPFDSAEAAFAVAPGAVIHAHEAHGDFTRVTDQGGRSGWLSTQAFTRLINRSRPSLGS